MKAIADPVLEKYGWNFGTYPTDEFRELLNKATDKLAPHVNQDVSDYLVYFKVKEEETDSDYDTCDNQKCIDASKKTIREDYGKYTRVEECWIDNGGDHERIEICSQCVKPLNEWLTWCESELEYLEQCYPLNTSFIKQEAFLIHSILQSSPTMDSDLNKHKNYSPTRVPQEDLDQREEWFQRIVMLAEAIIFTLDSQKSASDDAEGDV